MQDCDERDIFESNSLALDQIALKITEEDSKLRYDAFQGDTCVASLFARWLVKPTLIGLQKWEGAVQDSAILDAIVARVLADVRQHGSDVYVPLNGRTESIISALIAGGAIFNYEKQLFKRALTDLEEPSRHLTLLPMREVPLQTYYALFQDCNRGDPSFAKFATLNAAEFFESSAKAIGDMFAPDLMFAVTMAAAPIGILHFRTEIAADGKMGLMNYLGLHPDFRGQGLGIDIHRLGMRYLQQLGCTTYIGSTETLNLPMLRVFAHNHCELVVRQVFLRA